MRVREMVTSEGAAERKELRENERIRVRVLL